MCFKILKWKILLKFWRKNVICHHCRGKHAILIWFKYQRDHENLPKSEVENTLVSNEYYLPKKAHLQILLTKINKNYRVCLVRIILDTASSKFYVSSFVAKKLHLKILGKIKITHSRLFEIPKLVVSWSLFH